MTSKYRAIDIAKWFVAWANANEAELSNLKLQKLLYYAQGLHLATKNEPLFEDTIQAWSYGPVVPSVYQTFKSFQAGDLVLEDSDSFEFEDIDADTTQFLIGVWNTYGGIAAWKLRDMTHDESPWQDSFKDGVRGVEIPLDAMKNYFKTRL